MPQVTPALERDGSRNCRKLPIFRTCTGFVIQWLVLNGQDCVWMIILAVVTFVIYHLEVPVTRTFPITFDASGDIIYPEWAYPYRGWILPSWLSGLVSIGGPIVIYVLAQIRIKSFWDANSAIMGSIWAVLIGSFQVLTKILVGGFRPYFLEVCMPDISLAAFHNKTGLNAMGFQQVMYTTEICTQPDRMKLKTAITGFPSGHSTAAFAGFGFLFLWLNAKLKTWANYRSGFGSLVITMMPLLLAFMVACSLTIDAAHNWYDIVVGSAIGMAAALASYRSSYAAVWDWRYNHLLLHPREAFPYGADNEADYATRTWMRGVGWGKQRRWMAETPAQGGARKGGHPSSRSARPEDGALEGVNGQGQHARSRGMTAAEDLV